MAKVSKLRLRLPGADILNMALRYHSPFGRGYRPQFPKGGKVQLPPNPSRIKQAHHGHNVAGRPVAHRHKFDRPVFVESQMHAIHAPPHRVAGVSHHIRGVLRHRG